MSLVGGSAKNHQERRQQENPKQIHHNCICEATAEIASARNGLQRGLKLRDLARDEKTQRQPAKQLSCISLGGKKDECGDTTSKLTYSQRLGGRVQIPLVCCAAASPCPTAVTAPLSQVSWHETVSAKHCSCLI